MNKQLILLSLLSITTSEIFALTQAETQKKGRDILQVLVSGHNSAFGRDNLLNAPLDLSMWSPAITEMKKFVTTIIDENTSFFFGKDSTLINALDEVTKAEIALVNTIKISRSVLNSPADLKKQIGILDKIINNMIAVQKSLSSSWSTYKDEALKILKSTATFIEVTATKAKKDVTAALNQK